MGKFKFFHQIDSSDCGPAALRMVASYYGKQYSLESIRELCEKGKVGVNLLGISKAAEKIGFRTIGAKLTLGELVNGGLPAILHWNGNHFVVLLQVKKSKKGNIYHIADPALGMVKVNELEFKRCWFSSAVDGEGFGIALFLEPTPLFYQSPDEKQNFSSFKFLIKYLVPHRRLIVQLFIGLFAGSILQLAFPFLTQSVVDIGIGTRDINFIWLVLIAQLVLTISSVSVEFVRGWILLHIGARVNISLISDFLSKLMKLPIGFFDSKLTGDLLQRIGDHKRVQSFLTGVSLNVIFSLFSFVVFSIVLIYYSIKIFIVFFILSILYVLWVMFFLKYRRDLDNKVFTQNAANQSTIIQLITGMQEIKLNSCEDRRRWEWEHIQARLFKLSLKGLAIGQYQEAGATLINQVKNIIITIMAATAVINGSLTIGMMLSVQYIIGQLNAPLVSVISFIRASQDAKISLERLSEIHSKNNEESPLNNSLSDIPNSKSIILEKLSFKYEGAGSPFVLKDITMIIPPGKVTAIVGVSGSGKSTLIKLLLGFYKPTRGRIMYAGSDLDNYSMSDWRKGCGVVMQDGFIFSDTIARNIAPADDSIDMDRLDHACEVACIKEFIYQLPMKYSTKIGQDGVGLSQGQKQRILIARAIYKDPQYLIFDEATNSLDTKNEREIMEGLDREFKGKTVIVVAHRLSTVKNADNIVVLNDGFIVEQGSHDQLLANHSLYYQLVKNQLYV